MHRLHRLTLPILVVAVVSVCGCASPWKREIVSSEDPVFTYKEHKVVEGVRQELGLAHPTDVSARDLEAMLNHLVYRSQTLWWKPEELPVFESAETTSALADAIHDGLATLKPDERLRFLTTDSSFENIFRGTTGVSGVVFRTTDGKLHIALDRIHQPINDGHEGRPEDVMFPDDPTTLTDVSPVAPFPGSRRHNTDSATYPRWLEIDVDALAALPTTLPQPVATTAAGTTAAGTTAVTPTAATTADAGSPTNGVAEDVQPTTDATAGTDATPAVATPDTPVDTQPTDKGATAGAVTDATTATTPEEYDALRRKLERLKKLRDDGAIDDEEYRRQFDELMKKL